MQVVKPTAFAPFSDALEQICTFWPILNEPLPGQGLCRDEPKES